MTFPSSRDGDQKDESYPKPCLQLQTYLGEEGPLEVSGPTPCSKQSQLQRLNEFALGFVWLSFEDL